jgi:pyruvate dehydrogenase E1 component alpha subunit
MNKDETVNEADVNSISKDLLITILKKLLEIRRFEEKSIQLYQKNKLYGQLHPYLGEEAIAAGACLALDEKDYILSTHRGHGHCIARGADIKEMMAELFGKSTGSCNGRGGSMHIADSRLGILGANGIVGGGLPISVGVGLSSKIKKNGKVTICFFGDGAANNGSFHESLNMSAIFKLPVVYICENNQYAVSTNIKRSTSCENIADRSISYNIPGYKINGNDPVEVYLTVKKAVRHARQGNGPSLIEARTYRFTGHHLNDAEKYRDKEEVKFYRKTEDPVTNYVNKLLKENIISESDLNIIEEEIARKIEEAVIFAENSPEPSLDEFLEKIN